MKPRLIALALLAALSGVINAVGDIAGKCTTTPNSTFMRVRSASTIYVETLAYASSGSPAMAYSVHVRLYYMGL
jgi:hypothetical protein